MVASQSDKDDDRKHTDVKLQFERHRTDEELLERSNALGEDADDVIRRARERAATVLALARRREDESLARSSSGSEVTTTVATERAQADEALLLEYETADAAVGDERARRLRALIQLLATERDETDHALAVERRAADQIVAVRDDVLAGVTHDLRAHLSTVLLSASSLIMMRSRDHELVALGNTMLRAAAQMENLVADLLDVARMEAGGMEILPTRADLVPLVRNAIELNWQAAQARSIDLAFDATTPSIELQLDPARITRVLMNVLGNAIKFTPEGGRVTVGVEQAAGEVEIAVADTGPGIPPNQLDSIFERFRRAATGENRPGYGLGLYIARAIVNAHGGRIWAENNGQQGATFRIRLPAS